MRTLIVEDDFTSRLLLQEILKPFGPVHCAANGREAVEAVKAAVKAHEPYHLVCMDIMMPEMDGQQALREIRDIEEDEGMVANDASRILMTTALGSSDQIIKAFRGLCDAYLTKPIDKPKLLHSLQSFGLIE